mgnify:CR=1 FL=1|tara:strand:- start:606 stop:1187 length:582 start_codon:yes stop_codon:yes gene_type:complete
MSNAPITEEVEGHGGIRTITHTEEFENRESYEFYMEGLRCMRKNDFQCCLKYLEKALRIDPENPVILNDLGLTEKRLFNYDRAILFLQKAIQLDSNYYAAYGNLSLTLYYAKRYQEAIDILKLANTDRAGLTERRSIYYHLFMNHTQLNNCDSAYHYYKKAVQLETTNQLFLKNVRIFFIKEFNSHCPLHTDI